MASVQNSIVISFTAKTEAISKGVDKTNRELAKVKKQQAAFNKDLKGGMSALQKGLGSISQSLGGLSSAFGSMGGAGAGALGSVAAATGPVGIAIAALTAGVALFTAGLLSASTAAAEMADASARTEVDTEPLQALNALAKQTAVELSELENMLIKVANTTNDALGGNEKMLESYEALGITWDDLNNLGFEDLLHKISKATADGNVSAAERNALMDILGQKLGPRVLDFLRELGTTESVRKLTDDMREAGMVVEEGLVEKLDAIDRMLDEITIIIRKEFLTAFGLVVEEFNKAGVDAELLKGIIQDIATIVGALTPIVAKLLSLFAENIKEIAVYVKAIRGAFDSIKPVFDAIKSSMDALTSGQSYLRMMSLAGILLALRDKAISSNINAIAEGLKKAGDELNVPTSPGSPSTEPGADRTGGQSKDAIALDKFMEGQDKAEKRLIVLNNLLIEARRQGESGKAAEMAILQEIADIEQKKLDDYEKSQQGYNKVIAQIGTLDERIALARAQTSKEIEKLERESGKKLSPEQTAELIKRATDAELDRWNAEQDAATAGFNAIINQYGTASEKLALERERLEKLIEEIERDGNVLSPQFKEKILATATPEGVAAADRKKKLEDFMGSDDKGLTAEDKYKKELANIEELKAAAKEGGKETDDFLKKIEVYQDEVYDSAVRTGAVFDPLRQSILNLQDNAKEFGDTVAASFEEAIIQGEDLGDVLKNLAQDILRLLIRSTLTQPIASGISAGIGALFGGGKATGGDAEMGEFYKVGERGTELFAPGMDGRVVSNEQLRTAFGDGDGRGVAQTNFNIKQDFSLGVTAEARAVVIGMKSSIQKWAMEELQTQRAQGKLR